MIGFLSSGSQQSDVWRLAAFRRGLSESGYIEGRNVVSEFRLPWAISESDDPVAIIALAVSSRRRLT